MVREFNLSKTVVNSETDLAKQAFAERLNLAMELAGYPVRGRARVLSKKFDVSDKGAGKWIKGEAIPETAKIPLIAAFLNVNSEWLLSGVGTMKRQWHERNGLVGYSVEIPKKYQTVNVPEKHYVSGAAALNKRLATTGGLEKLIEKFMKMDSEGRLTEDFIKSIDSLVTVVEKAQETKDKVSNGSAPDTKTA